jgi:hypothetical protein
LYVVTVFRALACLTSLVILQACVEDKTVVVQQASQNAVVAGTAPRPAPARHTSPCAAPAGSGPFERLEAPLNPHGIVISWSPEAVAANVHGCVGVRYRIGPDGAPQDVTVLTEYPAGFGLGNSVLQAFSDLRWKPRDDLAWHFGIVYHNPAGAQHI